MDYFVLQPDFKTLRAYLGEYTDLQYEGHIKEFEAWNNVVQSNSFYRDEDVKGLQEGFKKIVEKFGLTDHYENLLYLSLHYHENIQNDYVDVIKNHASKEFMLEHGYSDFIEYGNIQRAKELASLILKLKQSPSDNQIITFSSKVYNNSVKIKDDKLSKWMCNLILDALEIHKYSVTTLGGKVLEMIMNDSEKSIDLEKVKAITAEKIHKPDKAVTQLLAKFSLPILSYLNNETTLRAKGVKYSDQQLQFLYDLLRVLKLLYLKQFEEGEFEMKDYQPKDYIRTLLP